MDAESFLKKNITKELMSQGFFRPLAESCANKGVEYYKNTAKFSGGAYLDCCNHAGMLAQQRSIGIKFKQVKAKRQCRTKRPQDAWDF
jgi:hypothetical protein